MVPDIGALGFQDKTMKGLQQAYASDRLLLEPKFSILVSCHLLVTLPTINITVFENAAHAYAQSGVSAAHLRPLYRQHNRCLASLADRHTCENRQVRSMPSASKVPASAGNNHSSVLAAATAASLLRRSVCCILPFNFLSAICSQQQY